MPQQQPQTPDRKLILHVGLHKTGTTWVQNVCDRNRARLSEAGIGYPDIGANHGWPLVFMALGSDVAPRYGAVIGMRRRNSDPERIRRNLSALAACFDDPRHRAILISGEQLSDAIRFNEVPRLAEILAPAKAAVTVLAYVRDPVSYAESMAQQRLKAGVTLAALHRDPPLPRYRARIAKFIKQYGRRNVDIRVYDRAALAGGDIVEDVLAAAGAPGLALDRPSPGAANAAMSASVASVIDARNRAMEAISPELARRHPPWAFRLLARLPGRRFALPEEVRRTVLERSQDDLAWLAERLGRQPFPDAVLPAPHAEAAQ